MDKEKMNEKELTEKEIEMVSGGIPGRIPGTGYPSIPVSPDSETCIYGDQPGIGYYVPKDSSKPQTCGNCGFYIMGEGCNTRC